MADIRGPILPLQLDPRNTPALVRDTQTKIFLEEFTGSFDRFWHFWRPWKPTKNNFLVKMKVFVYSWGLGIWVSSTSFWKSNIGWPQQPPSERVPYSSEKLGFWWSISQKMTSIGYFGAIDDQDQWVFWGNRAFEAVEASEVAEAAKVIEAKKISKGWKTTIEVFKVIQVLEFNSLRTNITLFRKFFFDRIWKKSCWILATFLSEAVEASLCHFFKYWLMKLKCPNLRNTQISSFWPKSCF